MIDASSQIGVGPVVSLTYRATVDVPARFRKSKSVGAVFGLTCAKYQSGEVDWDGRISRCGDEMIEETIGVDSRQLALRTREKSPPRCRGNQASPTSTFGRY